jgi:tRNA pseudouridine38-40 synthase
MRFLKITLAYDGGAYAGWQVQPDQPTIQHALEDAWRKVNGESLRIVASGRTDSGVHAIGQVASLATETERSCEVLTRALNANLADDIVLKSVEEAVDGFHAIRDAIGKRYRYVIDDGAAPNLFVREYAWRFAHGRLRVDAMDRAAKVLLGRHDFSSFEAAGAERKTSIRTITDIFIERRAGDTGETIVFEVAADGFLYNMVRNIVGTLVEVGRGARPESWVAEVLEARDRAQAGPTAPPKGLFLVNVDYE